MRRFAHSRSATLARVAVVGVLALSCGACSEAYLARRDTLSPGSGNAVYADIAMQAIDPSSPRASRVGMSTDGERLQHTMENYRNPSTGLAATTPAANVAVVPAIR